jgi:hypothetical protein
MAKWLPRKEKPPLSTPLERSKAEILHDAHQTI